LCGCGVCFKLIQAITERLHMPEEQYLAYLDLVVLATSADVVPIQDENRVLCHFGLAKANQTPCSGIQALKEAAGYDRALRMRDIIGRTRTRLTHIPQPKTPATPLRRGGKSRGAELRRDGAGI